MLMVHHWRNKYNGWYDRKLIDLFEKYVKVVFERYKNKVKYWLTFNEINCIALHPEIPSGIRISRDDPNFYNVVLNAAHNEFVASAKAVKLGHEINSDFKF